ncbi:MAG: helix-turn-helix transcriptional regulator [Alistipes sp.]|nr:helix-turn-helix transcriptional regulator [Alistipes sp.]
MKEKIEILMSDTSLRVGEIAEKLGVKPAVISHILKGRNQPNFVLTGKIISTFKEYNPYWWLGTSDVKFATDVNSTPSTSSEVAQKNSSSLFDKNPISTTQTLFDTLPSKGQSDSLPQLQSEIEQVIIIYKDKSFESFTPKK